jgi:AcrR family transcriptional regulator
VVERAGITAADFHRCFADLDDCLLAAFDGGAERALAQARDAAEAAVARDGAGPAVDGAGKAENGSGAAKGGPGSPAELVLRSMVGAVARCVGAEPKLAQVCLVESAALGPAAAERRRRLLDGFRRQLEEQLARVGPAPRPYASELIVGGIYEVVQLRVRNGEAGELADLAPSLAAVWVPLLRAGG